jgi:quinol---cytochrome c reductase iron-sulfur subunit, bacillus type
MNRRRFLKAFSGSLAAVWASVIAVPAVRYVMATIRKPHPQEAKNKRVARLSELPVGRPVSVAIIDSRRDAWTTYPDEPLGQVWLVRRDGDSVAPPQCRVDAYSSVCPHLHCRVQMNASKQEFVCPCHRGAFDLHGRPISTEKLGYRNPAPGPLETFAVKVVPDENKEWWVEVAYKG